MEARRKLRTQAHEIWPHSPEADGLLRLAISAEEATRKCKPNFARMLRVYQEKPGLFGTATGEYFDAAAKFEVFDAP